MKELRQRLVTDFETGTLEELSALLALIYLFSTHNKNGAGEAMNPQPARELTCKYPSHYSTNLSARN